MPTVDLTAQHSEGEGPHRWASAPGDPGVVYGDAVDGKLVIVCVGERALPAGVGCGGHG